MMDNKQPPTTPGERGSWAPSRRQSTNRTSIGPHSPIVQNQSGFSNRATASGGAAPPIVHNYNMKNNSNGHGSGPGAADDDLIKSLDQLTITNSSRSPARSPSSSLRVSTSTSSSSSTFTSRPSTSASVTRPPTSASVTRQASFSRSPSVASNRAPPRSPLNSRDRSATPTLLRKASLNSLASGGTTIMAPRRASSVTVRGSSPRSSLSPMPMEMPPRPVATAASVAQEYFTRELDNHHHTAPTTTPETIVILHDDCYGHRWSRPVKNRVELQNIVERPERIRASALGISAAYVRLGGRHAGGKHPVHPKLSPNAMTTPFRIVKTTRRVALLSPAVIKVHGDKWMGELTQLCNEAAAKLACPTSANEIQREDFNSGDLYLCQDSLAAMEGAIGGVVEAVDSIFTTNGPKRAFVAVRPPGHHCTDDFPSGFCWVNNVHVGIMHAILNHGVSHAAILDFDLHHGDGSQDIAWKLNRDGLRGAKTTAECKKPAIAYFSMHDIEAFPCATGNFQKVTAASVTIDGAHKQHVWNVHLEKWTTEAEFWALYETKYSILLEKCRSFLRKQAELARKTPHLKGRGVIFLSAGFDASEHEGDMNGHGVCLPTSFYARVARDVIRIAEDVGTRVEGRVISVLEGGYHDRALWTGIMSHVSGLAGEDPSAPTASEEMNGVVYETARQIDPSHRRSPSVSVKTKSAYDTAWWSSENVTALETAVAAPPPPDPRPPRYSTPPTYSSPTQASTARIVDRPVVRRSMSRMSMTGDEPSSSPISRAPSPPPPEVPWPVAAFELSKLLIPSDRETTSHTFEALSQIGKDKKAALKAQMVKTSDLPEGEAPAQRMSTRERKPVKQFGVISEEEELRKNRRKTTGSTVLAAEKVGSPSPSLVLTFNAAKRTVTRTPSPVELTPSPPKTSNPAAAKAARRPARPSRRTSIASTVVAEETLPEAPPLPLPAESINALPSQPTTSSSPRRSVSPRSRPGSSLQNKRQRPKIVIKNKKAAAADALLSPTLPPSNTTPPKQEPTPSPTQRSPRPKSQISISAYDPTSNTPAAITLSNPSTPARTALPSTPAPTAPSQAETILPSIERDLDPDRDELAPTPLPRAKVSSSGTPHPAFSTVPYRPNGAVGGAGSRVKLTATGNGKGSGSQPVTPRPMKREDVPVFRPDTPLKFAKVEKDEREIPDSQE